MENLETQKRADVADFEGKTLAQLMARAIHRFGERPFLGVKKNGVYTWMTFSEFDIQMRKLRAIFRREGLKRGDRVAIIANNSVEFALTVYAAYGLGGVVVPMYEVQKIQDWEFIFGDSRPTLAVVSNDSIREKIEGLNCPSLKKIYTTHPSTIAPDDELSKIIEKSEEFYDIDPDLTQDDLADIIYTSGTTGMPRGVELTHKNIVVNARCTATCFPIYETDRTLSFLPWAHAFGKTVELVIFPCVGSAIGLVESNRTIAQNLVEVNPTVLVSVPKIFNKIYDTVHLKAETKAITRTLFGKAEEIAKKSLKSKLSPFDKLQHAIFDKVVASKVRAAFGNSLRFCISGGASLSEEVASFFEGFGIKIFEGYGMTEHSPIVAVNTPGHTRIGSVGHPLPEVKIEISHDNDALDTTDDKCGEVVISSASVMKCYHNAPAATAEAIDPQGRLHTGDMGYIDDDGFLWLTGRVKEQYKLENGKYVVPSALEEKINNSTAINLSVVFGSAKPYNVVLINPTPEAIEKFKADNKLQNATNEELENNPKLRELYANELKTTTADFRGYERPQKFAIILDEFTIDNGLLTPALKIKRREIEKRFADTLDALYHNA